MHENAFLASNQPKRVPTKDQQPAPTQLGKLPISKAVFFRGVPCGHAAIPVHPIHTKPGFGSPGPLPSRRPFGSSVPHQARPLIMEGGRCQGNDFKRNREEKPKPTEKSSEILYDSIHVSDVLLPLFFLFGVEFWKFSNSTVNHKKNWTSP